MQETKIQFPLRAIDLFAGIGGIRAGFDRAFGQDIQTVFVSEWDQWAQKTYAANYKDDFPIAGDITSEETQRQIPAFDICLAGFPCQAFSMAGKRMGFEDDYKGMCRGTLFFEVAKICDRHKPKVIFCENVKGLTIHDKGRTFRIITQTLEQLGYRVFSKVLNSRDFGVPQNRERIYIVAFRDDIESSGFRFPDPTDSTKKLADIIEDKAVESKYYLSERYLENLRAHKARHAAKGHGFGYEVRSMDDVANAIVCGGMGRERNLVVDFRQKDLTPSPLVKGELNKEGIRKMTPREWCWRTRQLTHFRTPEIDPPNSPFSSIFGRERCSQRYQKARLRAWLYRDRSKTHNTTPKKHCKSARIFPDFSLLTKGCRSFILCASV